MEEEMQEEQPMTEEQATQTELSTNFIDKDKDSQQSTSILPILEEE